MFDVAQLKRQLDYIASHLGTAYEKGLTIAAKTAAEIARTQIGYTPRSPAGQGLQGKTVAYKSSAFDQGIIADTPYASWVEWGNGPPGSKIEPTTSSVLSWIDYETGERITVKWVRASAPHPFMAAALKWMQSEEPDKIVAHYLEEVFSEAAAL